MEMLEGYERGGLGPALTGGVPIHVVALRGPQDERRFPVDIIREDIVSLPASTWIVFQGDMLGEPSAYVADLMHRLIPFRRKWIGPASLTFVHKPALLALARQSGCQALLFDGRYISGQYLTSEAPAT